MVQYLFVLSLGMFHLGCTCENPHLFLFRNSYRMKYSVTSNDTWTKGHETPLIDI